MKRPFRTAIAIVALTQAAGAQKIDGRTYTTVMTMIPRATAGAMPAGTTITTRTVAAAGRLRSEVMEVSGGMPQAAVFEKGDYTIFSTSAVAHVTPRTRSFTIQHIDRQSIDSMLAASDLKMEFTVEKATVDSLGPGERIDGRPTTRYRTMLVQTVRVGTAGMDPARSTTQTMEITIEYWYADVGGPIPGAAIAGDLNSLLTSGPIAPMMRAMDSLMKRLPQTKLAVKTEALITIGMAGMLVTMENNSSIRNIKDGPVDAGLLSIPDDYVEMSEPAMGAPSGPVKATKEGNALRKAAWLAELKAKKP